jgi:mono/diheme cytochrome c family protein
MSGMPAWGQRLNDDDIWALAAFMLRLPKMSTADYTRMSVAQAQLECSAEPSPSDGPAAPAATSTPSVQDAPRGADDAETRRLGRIALRRHGCHGCHVIPGVVGSPRHVGPSLAGYGLRSTIKGRLPNSAEQLAAWIRAPQSLDPDSAMPTIAIGESDARAMAVYLRSLR